MRERDIRVLVIWEPILPTDWRRPMTSTLARVPDSRISQFWDPHHLASQEIQRSLASNNIPLHGHMSRGNLWDLALLYSAGPAFRNVLPAPAFVDGPVVDVAPELETQLQRASSITQPKAASSEASSRGHAITALWRGP